MVGMSDTNASPPTAALRLTDWGVVRAQGADAASFLHGQLTQDIANLPQDAARLAGYCTAKGRLLATMLVWRGNAEDELLLALPAELLAATVKRLSMFVLRAKCKLSDASSEFTVYGLQGQGGAAWTLRREGAAFEIALPGTARALRVQPADAPAPTGAPLSPEAWARGDVLAGLAWVRGATVEAFVPQMLNLEVLGGVNFQKGCYPGQEIVARSQYRGTLKRRTLMFAADAAATIGQELFHSEDREQPAGIVAGVATQGGQSLLLAEIKLAALERGSLHLGSASGPQLAAQPLPYALPQQE
jgi:hypothetical protein